ncbi:unnamed protein product [Ectocarpus fasciculatus]
MMMNTVVIFHALGRKRCFRRPQGRSCHRHYGDTFSAVGALAVFWQCSAVCGGGGESRKHGGGKRKVSPYCCSLDRIFHGGNFLAVRPYGCNSHVFCTRTNGKQTTFSSTCPSKGLAFGSRAWSSCFWRFATPTDALIHRIA